MTHRIDVPPSMRWSRSTLLGVALSRACVPARTGWPTRSFQYDGEAGVKHHITTKPSVRYIAVRR